MKYSAYFHKECKLNDFDEIKIIYDKDTTIEQLEKFLNEHRHQRVILVIPNIYDFIEKNIARKINVLHEEHPEYNIAVQLGENQAFNSYLLETACNHAIDMELKVPVFFGMHVTNFEELNAITSFQVSDVILAEEICFDLVRAKRLCDALGIRIRAIANVAQSRVRSTLPILKFFIRPEDVDTYAEFIDVLEFWGPEEKQEVLLKIYRGNKWYADLKDLILDFNSSLDSRRLVPIFGKMRTCCERRCLKGDTCRACYHIIDIHDTLKDKDLLIADK